MFVPRVDNRPYFAPLLLALIAIAWVSLFIWGESPYGRFLSHDELGHVDIGLNAEGVGIALVFVAGWTVMTIAMMLTSARQTSVAPWRSCVTRPTAVRRCRW